MNQHASMHSGTGASSGDLRFVNRTSDRRMWCPCVPLLMVSRFSVPASLCRWVYAADSALVHTSSDVVCPRGPQGGARKAEVSLIRRCVPPPRLIRSGKVYSICLTVYLLVAQLRWTYLLFAELNAWTAAGRTGTSSSKQATRRQRKKFWSCHSVYKVSQRLSERRCSLHTLAAAMWAAYWQANMLQVVGLVGIWCRLQYVCSTFI